MPTSRISIIAAIGQNRALGLQGKLLWHVPDDMRRFKELTTGHPVILGRKTWESIPEKFRPLPGRTNIVVTRQADYQAPGALVVDSLESARASAARTSGAEEIFVIGGAQVYAEALPLADRLYLTLVDDPAVGDVHFPSYEQEFTKVITEEPGTGDPPHRFITLERV
ncbi:diacylglycerol kinase [Candidatus Kaiserbacteria bacterium CG10_big_fil_rev_8_21_14_0_10_56_12]|uniref:Dihydrofolate reductase n=1 Tax=Candidatus Kaiserbacteria bacterium CG10_big_fil_rev_8_21_14_0_10_56_12 TaxID=1974611 RepID=A0A2H0U9M1_9BACT|nr:MAG: diacylglycerol kinase [Candidatus Kaiserbacteria bacterium CG10_big_fil_rev_8_21_14_0_10_56_12]